MQMHFRAAAIFASSPSIQPQIAVPPLLAIILLNSPFFFFGNYSSLLNDAIEFPFYSLTCFLLLCPQLPCVS